jgi:MraZ protein
VATLFRGTYEYTMDDRGRIPMPARFRDAFARGAVLAPVARCLRVYTTDAYEQTAALILRQGAHTERGQQLRREFFGRTFDGELDRAGRLLVPAALRQRLDLDGAVTVLGCGEYLELWSTPTCAAELADVAGRYPQLLGSLEPVEAHADASHAGDGGQGDGRDG